MFNHQIFPVYTVCFGNTTIDCMGVCGGDAYIDECSGTCIQPGRLLLTKKKFFKLIFLQKKNSQV